ncbi:hypothetical protein, partial [Aeromonas salmonicida]|uniref:hypothetical protein n=1 Tax=Aeromonas salmonicida TaxID=645 RepID=UPI0038CFD431
KNGLNRLIRGVYGRTIGPDPRNFNQRASLGRNDLLIRTFPSVDAYVGGGAGGQGRGGVGAVIVERIG